MMLVIVCILCSIRFIKGLWVQNDKSDKPESMTFKKKINVVFSRLYVHYFLANSRACCLLLPPYLEKMSFVISKGKDY